MKAFWGNFKILVKEYRFSLVLFILIGCSLLYNSGRFQKTPVVEAVPDNCYEQTMRVVTDSNYSPYSFLDENGNGQGYEVELITLIANKLHMNLEITFTTREESIAAVINGQADLLMTCDQADNFVGIEKLLKSQPVAIDDYVIYSRKKISSVNDLNGKRVSVTKDGNVAKKIRDLELSDSCNEYNDNSAVLKALLTDEADCAILRQSAGAVFLREFKKDGYDTDVKAYISVGQSYMCFDLAMRNVRYLSGLNKAIDELRFNGELERLTDKWLTTFVKPYSFLEIVENNRWIIILFVLYLAFSADSLFRNKRRWLEEKEKELKKEEMMHGQLQQALAEAQAANKAKTTFLNNMSHDIRTPMNAVMGYTELALSYIDNKGQVQNYLAKIKQSSSHLLLLINDVLDMSRIESGKMTLQEKEENLFIILHSLEDIVLADVRNKKLTMTVSYDDIRDGNIICDKLRLNQLLLNIIANAIKYTPEGGYVSLRVTQKPLKQDRDEYEFVIKDNGIGMSKEYLATIYQPFTREQTATVSGIQGTGLGMTIARKIVDMMGGTISIQSEQGKGTEVTLNFSFQLYEDDGQNRLESDAAGNSKPETSAVPAPAEQREAEKQPGRKISAFAGKKILLVEDNAFNREIACEILEEYGFIVDVAEDGSIAVEKMRTASAGDYDLVLMDVQMPVLDGYEATRQIRAMNTGISRIPIIAMTANAFEEDRKLALEAGMNEHLPKPIDFYKLEKVMERFIE